MYASLVLPPAWLVDSEPAPAGAAPAPWLDALRPVIWLLPFAIYVFVTALLLGALGMA